MAIQNGNLENQCNVADHHVSSCSCWFDDRGICSSQLSSVWLLSSTLLTSGKHIVDMLAADHCAETGHITGEYSESLFQAGGLTSMIRALAVAKSSFSMAEVRVV